MSPERLDPERLEELAVGHLLGSLDLEERAQFEDRLVEGDPEALRLVEEYAPAADALLLAAPPVAPPSWLKERILAAAGVKVTGAIDAAGPKPAGDAPTPTSPLPAAPTPAGPRRGDFMKMTPARRAERNWVLTGLALAAAAGLAIVSWQSLKAHQRLERATEELAEARLTMDGLRSELESVKATAARQAQLVRLLQEPESHLVSLASLTPAPGASARVLWDPAERKGYLWVRNLAPDAAGQDYQLWALSGKTPVSAGVFSVDAQGTALIPLDPLTSAPGPIGAFAITLEPAGGMPAPSGAILLMGSVTG